MAAKNDEQNPVITEKDIVGLKYFHKLDGLLEQLHDVGCELKMVQNKLGCARASLGSLSESVTVFDSERFKPIIEELSAKLKPVGSDKRLSHIKGLTLVDGSIVEALPRIAMASLRENQSGSSYKLKWTGLFRLASRSRRPAETNTMGEP